jgi:short-subunit dehydrogenase
MTRAFAERQVKLALVGHPGMDLAALCKSVESRGGQALALTADLRDPIQRRQLVDTVRARLGPVDLLINNAGVEFTCPYHELSEQQIEEVLRVNLEAPMALSRLVLPDMLARRQGHIVNISSLAGKAGPACQEPYAATKAALVAFTASLRASYCSSGVSASVIVPAFVEAGIYARLKASSGCQAPGLLTGCSAEQVAQAVFRAVERDAFELIVNRYPVRPMLALSALCPSLGEWLVRRIGVHDFFRRVVASQKRNAT